jgi:hypothetical protein
LRHGKVVPSTQTKMPCGGDAVRLPRHGDGKVIGTGQNGILTKRLGAG